MFRCYMAESCKENLAKSIVTDFPRLADLQASSQGGTGYVSISGVDFEMANATILHFLTNSITCFTFFV